MRRIFVATLTVAVACAHNPDRAPAAVVKNAPEPAAPANALSSTPALSTAKCSIDSECGSAQLCLESRCVDITPGLAACDSALVHFGYNEASIDRSERPILDRSARCLAANRHLHIVIEGNTDERGTTEYNLALGDRRATSVERYLEALGVARGQLRTASYGKEQPLCTEHVETCWSQNRRVSIHRVAGRSEDTR